MIDASEYIHVIVKTNISNKWEVWFQDILEPELIEEFVKNYKKGKNIFRNGKILKVDTIEEVVISKTNELLSVEIERLNDLEFERVIQSNADLNRGSSGFVFGLPPDLLSRADIRKHGINVTTEYLNSDVGSDIGPSKFLKAVNSPIISQNIGKIIAGIVLLISIVFAYVSEWFDQILLFFKNIT